MAMDGGARRGTADGGARARSGSAALGGAHVRPAKRGRAGRLGGRPRGRGPPVRLPRRRELDRRGGGRARRGAVPRARRGGPRRGRGGGGGVDRRAPLRRRRVLRVVGVVARVARGRRATPHAARRAPDDRRTGQGSRGAPPRRPPAKTPSSLARRHLDDTSTPPARPSLFSSLHAVVR